MKRIVAALATLMLVVMSGAACGPPAATTDSPEAGLKMGDPFQLGLGQTARIESDDLTVEFTGLAEDSRCPSDVVCVWEGQVTIVVRVSRGGEVVGEFRLTSRAGQDELAVADFDGYTIRLIAVEPYPVSTEAIVLSNYTATLVVSSAR